MKKETSTGISSKIGVLGGGQLGRMLIQESIDLNLSIDILDPDPLAPSKTYANQFVIGDFNDEKTVYDFGISKDIVTIEIEHVNINALKRLQKEGVKVYPQPEFLEIVQDKGLQKEFFRTNNIPTADFYLVNNTSEIVVENHSKPFILKMRKGGYDGKGVAKISNVNAISDVFNVPCVVEEMIDFEVEISVIVARNLSGEITNYPVVDMMFDPEANLVEFLFSPSSTNHEVQQKAITIATEVIKQSNMVGILAVEMFVTKDNQVLVNEIAPRPHNSGHQTIEGNITSQFAQHLRAILNLPLGDTSIIKPSVMLNLLGEKGYEGEAVYQGMNEAMSIPGVYIHLYGKRTTKPMRKMGHITVIDDDINTAIEKAKKVKSVFKIISNK